VELARANPGGIEEVTTHYAGIIERLPAPPVIIGHSFGGMIAEKLLGADLGAAAIAIDAAQIKGVLALPLSSLRSTLPVFKNPANAHRAGSLTAEQFRYGFGNAVLPEESDALYERWAIPAPGKPLFEAASANFSLHSPAGRHRQLRTGAAAAYHGRQGPHRPRGHHQVHAEAVPRLGRGDRPVRVPRPRTQPHHRQRLARGGRRMPLLAE
jgi:pimeloyl-ACP methyl ester carboxylesterase